MTDVSEPTRPSSPLDQLADRFVDEYAASKPTVATYIGVAGQNTPIAQNWNAIMTFRYTTAPEHEKDRNINPLGFQVVNYRSDPEA